MNDERDARSRYRRRRRVAGAALALLAGVGAAKISYDAGQASKANSPACVLLANPETNPSLWAIAERLHVPQNQVVDHETTANGGVGPVRPSFEDLQVGDSVVAPHVPVNVCLEVGGRVVESQKT